MAGRITKDFRSPPLNAFWRLYFAIGGVPQQIDAMLWTDFSMGYVTRVLESSAKGYAILFYTVEAVQLFAILFIGALLSARRPMLSARQWHFTSQLTQLITLPIVYSTCTSCPRQPMHQETPWCSPFAFMLPVLMVNKIAAAALDITYPVLVCEVQATRHQRDELIWTSYIVNCVLQVLVYGGWLGLSEMTADRTSYPSLNFGDCVHFGNAVLTMVSASGVCMVLFQFVVLPCVSFVERRRRLRVHEMKERRRRFGAGYHQVTPWETLWLLLCTPLCYKVTFMFTAATMFYKGVFGNIALWYTDMIDRVPSKVRLLNSRAESIMDRYADRSDDDKVVKMFHLTIISWVGMLMAGSAFVAALWLRWLSGLHEHPRWMYLVGVLMGGNLSMWVLLHLRHPPMVGEFGLAAVLFGMASSLMYVSAWRVFFDLVEPDLRGNPPMWQFPMCMAVCRFIEHLVNRVIVGGLEIFEAYVLGAPVFKFQPKTQFRVHWGLVCLLAVLTGVVSLLALGKRRTVAQTRALIGSPSLLSGSTMQFQVGR